MKFSKISPPYFTPFPLYAAVFISYFNFFFSFCTDFTEIFYTHRSINMKTAFFLLVSTIMVIEFVSGFSSSRSCSTVNGQEVCREQSDPNGNSARAGSYSNGVNGYDQYAIARQVQQPYPPFPYQPAPCK